MSSFPTGVDPVKDTFRTAGFFVSSSPTSTVLFKAEMKLTTPFGTPARWASSASARDVNGVSPGDLATTVQPAASAGAIFRVIIAAGKFHLSQLSVLEARDTAQDSHGVIRPHTPTGCLSVYILFPGMLAGMVSP